METDLLCPTLFICASRGEILISSGIEVLQYMNLYVPSFTVNR